MAQYGRVKQVQKTNDCSVVSKLSMCQLGYYKDPFLEYFVLKSSRRSPLINRGYHIRAKALERITSAFLKVYTCSLDNAQIISLGAGFDTLYFRYKDVLASANCKVFEVDFPSVMSRKCAIIKSYKELCEVIGPTEELEGIFMSQNYCILGCDLTNMSLLEKMLTLSGVNFSKPTLFLSECVLTYIEADKVNNIYRWILTSFPNSLVSTYEQIIPSDGFGQVMKQHFKTIGSPLQNIDLYPSKSSQTRRMLQLGFSSSFSCDMTELFEVLPSEEKHQLNLLEPFDEFEELFLKFDHYSLLWAANGECCRHLPNLFPQQTPASELVKHGEIDLECITMSDSSAVINRFGHASVCLPGGVVIIGGFGTSDLTNIHGRLSDVLHFCTTLEQSVSTCMSLKCYGDVPAGIVHHKAVLLQDGRVLVTGGRHSPIAPCQDFFALTIKSGNSCFWERIKPTSTSDVMEPRWRHTATKIDHHDEECIIVVGGCVSASQAVGNIFLVKPSNWSCSKLPVCLPEGVHSHSAFGVDGGVVIVGGLNTDMVSLSTCYFIVHDHDVWTLSEISFTCPIPSRFSCGNCVYSDTLVLMGGIGKMSNLEVLLVNMKSKDWRRLEIKAPNFPVLLHSFTVHHIGNGVIWIFGGGGNCFSFGTYFNPSPLQVCVDFHF